MVVNFYVLHFMKDEVTPRYKLLKYISVLVQNSEFSLKLEILTALYTPPPCVIYTED